MRREGSVGVKALDEHRDDTLIVARGEGGQSRISEDSIFSCECSQYLQSGGLRSYRECLCVASGVAVGEVGDELEESVQRPWGRGFTE
jgi:hypothetical protein